LISRLWLNNHGLGGFGDNGELFHEFGVGFGEGFAIELFIDLFDAFPGADTFDYRSFVAYGSRFMGDVDGGY
jgi:hypothetical protein